MKQTLRSLKIKLENAEIKAHLYDERCQDWDSGRSASDHALYVKYDSKCKKLEKQIEAKRKQLRKYYQLSKKAKAVAVKEYKKGWECTHEEDDLNEYDIHNILKQKEDLYNKNGTLAECEEEA